VSRSPATQRDPEELLRRLNGSTFDGLTLLLRKIYRPKARETEIRYFELVVKNLKGEISRDAVINGFYSSGRPSISLKSYFDISFNYKPRFKDQLNRVLDLSKSGLDIQIFKALSEIVDPAGKIIVSISAPEDLDLINETFRYLNADLPYEATYLGNLLFQCGCGAFFKAWLIREGGREGPAALQGEKALDELHRLRGLRESTVRLTRFLEETKNWSQLENARVRALSILQTIQLDDNAL
jgi:hypothetical protein